MFTQAALTAETALWDATGNNKAFLQLQNTGDLDGRPFLIRIALRMSTQAGGQTCAAKLYWNGSANVNVGAPISGDVLLAASSAVPLTGQTKMFYMQAYCIWDIASNFLNGSFSYLFGSTYMADQPFLSGPVLISTQNQTQLQFYVSTITTGGAALTVGVMDYSMEMA